MATADGAKRLTAADVMTREVATVAADATLQEVAMLLGTRNISGAPVVDETGKMIGILSESDLLSETRRRAGMPSIAAFGIFFVPQETLERVYHNGATLLAREVMTKDVITVMETTPVEQVMRLMVNEKVNRVPVLKEGELVGIITRHDLLQALFLLHAD